MKTDYIILSSLVLLMLRATLPAVSPSEHAVDTADTVSALPRQNPDAAVPGETEEIILGEIEIKGKVEKPGVYVMPARIEPELEEMELGRSFQNELKDGARATPRPENKLSEVDKVTSITKAVERKRN